jgi:hypothetical protein
MNGVRKNYSFLPMTMEWGFSIIMMTDNALEGFIKRWSTDRNPIVNYPDGREEPNLKL